MAYQFPPEVDPLVKQHMTSGVYVSEDDLLLEALRSLSREREEFAAIQVGLDSLERGEQGVTLDEAFDAIRSKHNVPTDA